MRRDLVIGSLVALAAHIGTVWLGELNRKGPPLREKSVQLAAIPMAFPPLDPEEPEVSEEKTDEPILDKDFTPPPMLPELMPPPTDDTPFVQKPQPPVPISEFDTGVITIPPGPLVAGRGEIFDASRLDQIPVATFQPEPVYPVDMRRTGVQASVAVEFIVDSAGTVIAAHAVSDPKEFQAAAVAGVKKWKFKPGTKAGKRVTSRLLVDIRFTVQL